jgi:hypothetical protein
MRTVDATVGMESPLARVCAGAAVTMPQGEANYADSKISSAVVSLLSLGIIRWSA